MTNMWLGVDAEDLCDQHLLGLHKELHQEVGTLENHPYGEAIVAGHFRLGQVSMEKIGGRHDEVVAEMRRRGMNHDSELSFKSAAGFRSWLLGFPVEKLVRVSLAARCDDCFS